MQQNIHAVIILFLIIFFLLRNTKEVKPWNRCNKDKNFATDRVVQDAV